MWRGYTVAGVEASYGVSAAPSRQMYYEDPTFTRTREPRPHKFATGTRDNTRAITLGPQVVSGKLKLPMSADEITELLLIGVQGGVGAAGSYVPSSTVPLDSATFQWYDGAQGWEANGCYANKLMIKGSAGKSNDVEVDLFGASLAPVTAATGLTQRVPTVIEGWESLLYVDAIGATSGSTNVAHTLVNWDVTIDNQLKRKYFADNTNAMGAAILDELKIEAKLTFEAAATLTTEYDNWDSSTYRLVRLAFGNHNTVGGADHGLVAIDLPGAWTAFDLGKKDEATRVYELTLSYVYDVANAFGLRVVVENGRGAAWAAV